MNTQTKHTPGPEHNCNYDNTCCNPPWALIKGATIGLVIKDSANNTVLSESKGLRNEQHAHLIAAAPALLEALRLAEHNLTEIENYIGGDAVPAGLLDTVRAAIAQAEGNTL